MSADQRAHERFRKAVRAKLKAEGKPLPEDNPDAEADEELKRSLINAMGGLKDGSKSYSR